MHGVRKPLWYDRVSMMDITLESLRAKAVESISEDITASTVREDTALDVEISIHTCRCGAVARAPFERHIIEVKFSALVAFDLGDIQDEYLRSESEKGLLNDLSSSEQLLAALRSLTSFLVCGPILGLASFAAVERQGASAVDLDSSTASAVSGSWLTAGRAGSGCRALRSHG